MTMTTTDDDDDRPRKDEKPSYDLDEDEYDFKPDTGVNEGSASGKLGAMILPSRSGSTSGCTGAHALRPTCGR